MTRPSKGAAAFLIFFGLMFFIPGLLSLYSFLARIANTGSSGTMAAAGIALFISSIGGALILAALAGYGRVKQQAAREEANPSSPWLWRTDWASRSAESLRKNRQITMWVICILCNLVMVPVAANVAPQLASHKDPRVFLVLGFCSIGVILFVVAVRASLRHQRFGDTYFELYTLPFSPGDRLGGRIHLKLDTNAEHGIDLRLACVRRTVTGSGNNRSTVQTVLWQADQNVPAGAIGMDPLGRTIPVDFAIPPDAYVTDHDNPSDQVLWLLHAQADIPGIDYSDDFEVPVFRTSAATAQAPASSSENFGITATTFSEADSASVAAPADSKVVISSQDGGTEFYFRAFRTPSRAIFLIVFTAIWSGVVYLFFSLERSLVFRVRLWLF